jgi:hypothetical protein
VELRLKVDLHLEGGRRRDAVVGGRGVGSGGGGAGGRPPPSLYPLTSASRGDGVTVGRRWRNEVEGGGDWGGGVSKSELSVFVSAKNVNMDIRIRF